MRRLRDMRLRRSGLEEARLKFRASGGGTTTVNELGKILRQMGADGMLDDEGYVDSDLYLEALQVFGDYLTTGLKYSGKFTFRSELGSSDYRKGAAWSGFVNDTHGFEEFELMKKILKVVWDTNHPTELPRGVWKSSIHLHGKITDFLGQSREVRRMAKNTRRSEDEAYEIVDDHLFLSIQEFKNMLHVVEEIAEKL